MFNVYDLIIIGAGPAGVTAGIYAARKKLTTLLLTRDFVGQVGKAFLIENYPGFEKGIRGAELASRFKSHLQRFEINIKEGEGVNNISQEKDKTFDVQTEKENIFQARAVIIATGRDPRPLEVPGEKEFLGRGVGYCVTCDGVLFQGKAVAVIGGGNSGFDAALELAQYCSKVYILEYTSKVLADEITQERVKKNTKIQVILNADSKEIKGDKFVKGMVYKDRQTDKETELSVQGVFIQIGYIPATGFVKDLVEFNEQDEIMIDPLTCATKTPGLFAAGDVTDISVKQIIAAAAEGAKAALSAYKHLQELK